MKALTIRQPWATLIVRGAKLVEYRPWRPAQLPLRVCIHAAAVADRSAFSLAALIAWGQCLNKLELDINRLPLGVLLGEVTILGVARTPETSPFARFGRFEWQLAAASQYREVIPARGALGLWDVDRGIEAAL